MQYQRIKASKVPQWDFYRLCFSRAVTCFLLLNIFKRTLTAARIRLNASAKVGTDQSALGFNGEMQTRAEASADYRSEGSG